MNVRSATGIGVRAAQTALIQNVTVARDWLHMPPNSERPATCNIDPDPQRTIIGCAANVAARLIDNGATMSVPTVAMSSVTGAPTCRAGVQG